MNYEYTSDSYHGVGELNADLAKMVADGWEPFMMSGDNNYGGICVMYRRTKRPNPF